MAETWMMWPWLKTPTLDKFNLSVLTLLWVLVIVDGDGDFDVDGDGHDNVELM